MIIARIIRNIILIFLLYVVILTFQFFIFRLALPDPTVIYLREGIPPEIREEIKRSFGLDKPLYIQYILYITNFFRGDMGVSFLYKTPVSEIIIDRLANTLILVVPAITTAYFLGRVIGSYMAFYRGSLLEKILVGLLSIVNSLPLFWISMLSILIFSIYLGILPLGGMRTPPYEARNFFEKIFNLDFLYHWILPYANMTIYALTTPAFLMRSSMITALEEDFVTALNAIGYSSKKIRSEVSRYSIIPLITQMGVSLGLSFAGSVAFETVFSWPGIGRELVIALNNLDYPLAQGVFAVMSLAIITINSIVDILYAYLDPRTRRSQ
ncbi:MAG: ABC transporter permease [Sulfolobales archaeon]|jgi:peptide/nickel transport system permease protein